MRALLAFSAAATLAAPVAWADGCDIPLDAALRLNVTPYHMRLVATDDAGTSDATEVITTEDATYVKVGRRWHRGPKEALTLQDLDAPGTSLSCRFLRPDTLGGAAVDVWQVEDDSDPDEVKHQTVWISRDTGRVLRLEIVIDAAGEPAMSRVSADIDYTDVVPPQ